MRTIFLFVVVVQFHNVFGQLRATDYAIFSDVVQHFQTIPAKHRFLMSDLTMPFKIDLSNVDPYIHKRSEENFKLAVLLIRA